MSVDITDQKKKKKTFKNRKSICLFRHTRLPAGMGLVKKKKNPHTQKKKKKKKLKTNEAGL